MVIDLLEMHTVRSIYQFIHAKGHMLSQHYAIIKVKADITRQSRQNDKAEKK